MIPKWSGHVQKTSYSCPWLYKAFLFLYSTFRSSVSKLFFWEPLLAVIVRSQLKTSLFSTFVQSSLSTWELSSNWTISSNWKISYNSTLSLYLLCHSIPHICSSTQTYFLFWVLYTFNPIFLFSTFWSFWSPYPFGLPNFLIFLSHSPYFLSYSRLLPSFVIHSASTFFLLLLIPTVPFPQEWYPLWYPFSISRIVMQFS